MRRLCSLVTATSARRSYSSAILLEHTKGKLHEASLAALMAAKQAQVAGGLVGVLPVADECAPVVSEARKLGLTKLVVGTHDSFAHLLPETTAVWMAQLQAKEGFTHWWAASTSVGKGLLPRLAGILLRAGTVADVVPISDIIQVIDERTFVRPIYAGNALSQVRSEGPCTIITVRATSFPYTREPTVSGAETPVETLALSPPGTGRPRSVVDAAQLTCRG